MGFAPLLISVEGQLRLLAFCVSCKAALAQHLLDLPVNLDYVIFPTFSMSNGSPGTMDLLE